MNKRIEELAEQYREQVGRGFGNAIGLDYDETFDEEKFAELIIQSIANIDFRGKIGVTSDQDFDIRNLIKNHFKDEQ